ncbi:MAG: hypothetical protein ACLGIT_07165 [Gammaproteobacteria bacterium]|uniref:hypothetical protein n=1 Tax=Azohydromonas sp. TaxID=1872666 RepID=UPI002C095D1A|nr:hypothetical protein [Azohydromonas sp.]HMM85430.1 hypothetical protein [Azohydromonas sp.]
MASRLLARLDDAIARARDPVDAACLRAERAGLIARLGRLDEARREIDAIKSRFALRPQAAVSAWLALSEGLVEHFGAVAPGARDLVQRAHALSGAAHLAPLRALAAAWLAHMDYGRNELSQMAAHLAESLRLAAADHHAARERACQVAALAYHWAGRLDRAQPWYDRARQHALADGDDAGLSALMYNRATALVANVRLAGVDGAVEDADATTAWKEAALCVQSFAAYEAGIGGAAMAYMVPLLHAQVLAAQGQPAQALVLYERWSGDATRAGARRLRPLLAADAAWCRVQVGQLDAARRDLATALPDADAGCDLDDRVLANARLAQVARALGEAALADTLRDRARRDLAVLRAEQSRLSDLLDDALAGL